MNGPKREELGKEGTNKARSSRQVSLSSESKRANSNGTKHPQIFEQKP